MAWPLGWWAWALRCTNHPSDRFQTPMGLSPSTSTSASPLCRLSSSHIFYTTTPNHELNFLNDTIYQGSGRIIVVTLGELVRESKLFIWEARKNWKENKISKFQLGRPNCLPILIGIRKHLKEVQIQNCFLQEILGQRRRKCGKRKTIFLLDSFKSQDEPNSLYPFPSYYTSSFPSTLSLPLAHSPSCLAGQKLPKLN